MISNVNN